MSSSVNINKSVFVSIRTMIYGKWRLPVLWHIANGNNRFSILKKNINEISEKMLHEELKQLISIGIVRKEVVDDTPPKTIIYHINDEYSELIDIINELYKLTMNKFI